MPTEDIAEGRSTIGPFEKTDNDCIHIGPMLPKGTVISRRMPSSHLGFYIERNVEIGGYPLCTVSGNCVFTKAGAAEACSKYKPTTTKGDVNERS